MPATLLPLSLALALPSIDDAPRLEQVWSAPLGEGFSSVSATDERAFVSSRQPGSSQSEVTAVALATGDVVWRTGFADAERSGQENYGGGRGPHATPLVIDDVVIALGYAGRLVALAEEDGEALWSIDLVDELDAEPVQFGFAASAVAWGDTVLVMTGGASGITAFDAHSGAVRWQSPAAGASYVTPVLRSFAETPHLVCLFQDETTGIDPNDGSVLWSVPHVRPGLTNFAMIAGLDNGGVVVSGQGLRGARRIDVARDGEGWRASVSWFARRVQFSHGRVLEQNGLLWGSDGTLLCAVASSDGEVRCRLRGFGESNLLDWNGQTARVDEDGELTLLELDDEDPRIRLTQQVLQPKAWAAPTIAGDLLLLRDAERLIALRLQNGTAGD